MQYPFRDGFSNEQIRADETRVMEMLIYKLIRRLPQSSVRFYLSNVVYVVGLD